MPRRGVGFFLTWRKSLRSFSERGGWAPFMPNITILIALMPFIEEGEGREKRESPESAAATQPGMFNHCLAPTLLILLAEYDL